MIWTGQIQLPDVDTTTGHVLIHYLHTATYETLNDSVDEDDHKSKRETMIHEFRKAVLVLEAATRYEITGLQQLAQLEMERTGSDINLHDTVRAIQDSIMAETPNGPSWIQNYVSQRIRSTFIQNPETIADPDFFEDIENRALIKLLARTIVGLYNEELAELRKEKIANIQTPIPTHTVLSTEPDPLNLLQLSFRRSDQNPLPGPVSPEKFGAFDDSVAAWDPRTLELGHNSTTEANEPPLAASYSENKTKGGMPQRIKEQPEAKTTKVDLLSNEPAEAMSGLLNNIDLDPVVGEMDAPNIPKKKKKQAEFFIAEVSPPIVEDPERELCTPIDVLKEIVDSPGTPTTSKMKKKKKKSKLTTQLFSSVLITELVSEPSTEVKPARELESIPGAEPLLEVEPVLQAEIFPEAEPLHEALMRDRFAGASKIQKKIPVKSLAAQGAGNEQENTEYEKIDEEAERHETRSKQIDANPTKIEARSEQLGAEAPVITVMEAEAGKWENQRFSNDWDSTSNVSKKKKKSKKSASLALDPAITCPSDPAESQAGEHAEWTMAEPPTEDPNATIESVLVQEADDSWSNRGSVSSPSKKKKKRKKAKVAVEADTPVQEQEEILGSDLIEPELGPLPTVHSPEVHESISGAETPSNSPKCFMRLEHLSKTNGWKSCKPCELYTQQVALQLYTAELSDMNQLNVGRCC